MMGLECISSNRDDAHNCMPKMTAENMLETLVTLAKGKELYMYFKI